MTDSIKKALEEFKSKFKPRENKNRAVVELRVVKIPTVVYWLTKTLL